LGRGNDVRVLRRIVGLPIVLRFRSSGPAAAPLRVAGSVKFDRNMLSDQSLDIGSRSGAFMALCFFVLFFLALGWGVAQLLARHGCSRVASRLCGGLVFVLPFAWLYSSSLSGFYAAELNADGVRLTYLVPTISKSISLSSVLRVQAQPALRGSWRVYVITSDAKNYHSALSTEKTAISAARRMDDYFRKQAPENHSEAPTVERKR
jgi:hypothetical protein